MGDCKGCGKKLPLNSKVNSSSSMCCGVRLRKRVEEDGGWKITEYCKVCGKVFRSMRKKDE